MEMGKKIYTLRTQKGLTLEELGNMVGVGKSTVRKWENGMIANMKRDKIMKVSEALGTTPEYLMGWDESGGESSFTPKDQRDIAKDLKRKVIPTPIPPTKRYIFISLKIINKEKYTPKKYKK